MSSSLETSSLSQEVASWEARVKEARTKGDQVAILQIAKTAADAIEKLVHKSADWDQEEIAALTAVKRVTYNAAADAWPGWELDGPILDTAYLKEAQVLAQRSADWCAKLQLGAIHEATGIWLVGAFDLAMAQYDEAVSRFSASSEQYRTAPAPALKLLSDGYTEIAKGLRSRDSPEDITVKLQGVFTELESGGFKNPTQWIEQLRTALAAFSERKG